jgi:HPt (histidine-containing phosphotransfer) domain-containing protein
VEKLFDHDKFIQQTAGDRNIAVQVFFLYRDSIEADLDQMERAAEQLDFAALCRLAHKSKSGFIIMGSDTLFALSRELETLSREKNPDALKLIPEYRSLSLLLLEQLREEFGNE